MLQHREMDYEQKCTPSSISVYPVCSMGQSRTPRSFLLALSILTLSLVVLFLVDTESSASETIWENSSNLTGFVDIEALDINSVDNSVIVLTNSDIEEWTLEGQVRLGRIETEFRGTTDIEWSDQFKWISIISLGMKSDQSKSSPLVILDKDGEIEYEFSPWGNLEPYDDSTIVDLEWRPQSSQIAVLFANGHLRLYDVTDAQSFKDWQFESTGMKIGWDRTGEYLSVMTSSRTDEKDVEIIAVDSDSTWQVVKGDTSIHDIGWSWDSRTLYLQRSDGISGYNLTDATTEKMIEIQGDLFYASPGSPYVAVVDDTRGLFFWNLRENTIERNTFNRPLGTNGHWNRDGSYFVIDEEDSGVIRIWTMGPSTAPPEVTILSPDDGATVSGDVQISGDIISEYGTGFVLVKIGNNDWIPATGYVEWHLDFNSEQLVDGLVLIRAKASDPSGVSEIASVQVHVDNGQSNPNEPPEVSITSPSDSQQVWNIVDITGIASDDHAVVSLQLKNGIYPWVSIPIGDGGASIEWTTHILVVSGRGNLTIQVRAFDGLLYSSIASVVIDIKPPEYNSLTVIIERPQEGSEVNTPFNCEGKVQGGEPTALFLQVDTDPLEQLNGTTTWSHTIFDLVPGVHSIQVYAVDEIGISHTVFASFTVASIFDNDPPRVGFTDGPDGTVVTENIVVRGWSSDDQLVTRVLLRLNDGEWEIVTGTEEWTYDIDISSLDDGWNVIEVKASDGELFSDVISARFYHPTDEGPNKVSTTSRWLISLVVALVILLVIESAYVYFSHKRQGEHQ